MSRKTSNYLLGMSICMGLVSLHGLEIVELGRGATIFALVSLVFAFLVLSSSLQDRKAKKS